MTARGEGQRRSVAQVAHLVEQVRTVAQKPSVRPWLLLAAALLFVGITYVSFVSLEDEGRSARPMLLIPVVLVGVPATLLFNALEYRAMARALGHRVGLESAARIGIAATLANYLPAPGGVAIRTAALKGRGSSLGSAVSVNAVAGLLWLGVAGLATGIALLASGSLILRAVLATAIGAVAIVGSVLWARRGGSGWQGTFRELLLVESGIVLVSGVRVWFALVAIGSTAGFGAAVAIASSTVLAAAVGIFPGGLGIREAFGGGLGLAFNMPWSTAVAALSVDRLVGPIGLGLCALAIGLRRRYARGALADDAMAAADTTEPATVTGD